MVCSKCLKEFVPAHTIEGELVQGDVHILVRGMEMHESCFKGLKIVWWDESSYQRALRGAQRPHFSTTPLSSIPQ